MTEKIETLVTALGNQLKQRQWKCVTAESCTGGGLAYWITSVPGSSAWFDHGLVTYSNESKIALLSISPDTIRSQGSVSEATACEMAEGALRHSAAQISVSITGIAGPDGGTVEKPVGMVWMACASIAAPTFTFCHYLSGDRQQIRNHAIEQAIEMLLTGLTSA